MTVSEKIDTALLATFQSVSVSWATDQGATLADVQAAYRPFHSTHRGDVQGIVGHHLISNGLVTNEQYLSWLSALASLPTVVASRRRRELTDDETAAVRAAVVGRLALLAGWTLPDGATTDVPTAADVVNIDDLVSRCADAIGATLANVTGHRTPTTLVPLTVGATLVHGEHRCRVASVDPVRVTLKGSAETLSLSAAARLCQPGSKAVGGRRYWTMPDGSPIVRS